MKCKFSIEKKRETVYSWWECENNEGWVRPTRCVSKTRRSELNSSGHPSEMGRPKKQNPPALFRACTCAVWEEPQVTNKGQVHYVIMLPSLQ